MRDSFARGYSKRDLRTDVLAGLTVGVIALPLSMRWRSRPASRRNTGSTPRSWRAPSTALAGGSRFQVSGPTAAFVVILAPIAATYGVGGLLVATAMAGVMLLLLGFFRLGRLIQFIPYPVTAGFTAGIGVSGFDTISDRFSYMIDGVAGRGIPQAAPHFDLPWHFPGPNGHEAIGFSWGMLRTCSCPP